LADYNYNESDKETQSPLGVEEVEGIVAEKMLHDATKGKLFEKQEKRFLACLEDINAFGITPDGYNVIEKAEQLAFLKETKNEGTFENLVTLKMALFTDGFHPVPEDRHSGEMFVTVGPIFFSFYMQQLMRMINFFTDHLIPCLVPEGEATEEAAISLKDQVAMMTEETALKNLEAASWLKMDILVKSPQVNIKASHESTHFLQANLGSIQVISLSNTSKTKIYKDFDLTKLKALGISEKPNGIWYDQFNIIISHMNVKEIKVLSGASCKKEIIHPFDIFLGIQIPKFLVEYSKLFNAMTDPRKAHKLYNLYNKDPLPLQDPAFDGVDLAYDSSMILTFTASPMVIYFGKHEYNFIMKS
jgi:hypothetical protein